jgi:hypothetical protein
MTTHKFSDPKIQARFEEVKARRAQVIAQEAENVFDVYLLKLATGESLPIFITDKNLNHKSSGEVGTIIKLLEQKDKQTTVERITWFWPFRYWLIRRKDGKSKKRSS